MDSVFELLRNIRERPGMYVGGTDDERTEQLHNLTWLLLGYQLAIRKHAAEDGGQDFLLRFGDYLRARFGWSVECGPVATIVAESPDANRAWDTLWKLVDEFRLSLEASPSPENPDRG